MGEFAKWALLGIGIAVVCGLIFSLPIFGNIPGVIGEMSRGVNDLLTYVGSAFVTARGLVNLLVYPGTEWLVTLVISWLIVRPFRSATVRITLAVYHWIFK